KVLERVTVGTTVAGHREVSALTEAGGAGVVAEALLQRAGVRALENGLVPRETKTRDVHDGEGPALRVPLLPRRAAAGRTGPGGVPGAVGARGPGPLLRPLLPQPVDLVVHDAVGPHAGPEEHVGDEEHDHEIGRASCREGGTVS